MGSWRQRNFISADNLDFKDKVQYKIQNNVFSGGSCLCSTQDLAFHGAGLLGRLGCNDDADGDADTDDGDANDEDDVNDDDAVDDDEHKWK